MSIKPCAQCGEYKQLTHRIKSQILNMEVCYPCGVHAEIVQGGAGTAPELGAMTITLFERPKVIPMFFNCSLCGGQFTSEHQYQNHWHEEHC